MARKKYVRIRKRNFTFVLVSIFLLGFILGMSYNKVETLGSSSSSFAVKEISPRDLKEKLKNKNFTFVNVHTPYEGEIERTDTFIEFDSMKASENLLPKDKNTPIVLYCESENMSKQALGTLKEMGYTNVSHLAGGMNAWRKTGYEILDLSRLPENVLPKEGFVLPVNWGRLGPRLIASGVIDLAKFEKAVTLTDEQRKILTSGGDIPVTIDSTNSQFVVDLLWTVGLAQKSLVYVDGPLGKEYKNQAGNFASTGGWTLAKGQAVSYLNKFDLIALNSEQQERVAEIAKNIYRPSCGNSTWFPDCNHGMAALAAIELMLSKGISEEEIYKNVLKLNSFWFPQNYLTTATYFARQGTSWDKVDAKLALGAEYSSGQGAAKLNEKVGTLPFDTKLGGSCGA